jgi:hypothetical protein
MSHHSHERCLKFLRWEEFRLVILSGWRNDEAFDGIHLSPCWPSIPRRHEKPVAQKSPSYVLVS